MRNLSSFSALVRNAADAATGNAPAFNAADTSTSNVAADKPVRKPARKLSGKATKPASGKPAKQPTKPATAKPAQPVEIHGLANSYRGASPVFRGHARKLSVIVLGRIPGTYTDRDHAALKAVYGKHGTKPFPAYDLDRGVISRLESHKLISHVSGDLSLRDCRFAVTAHAVKTKLGKAAAPKA
jgi:hypothetical protein